MVVFIISGGFEMPSRNTQTRNSGLSLLLQRLFLLHTLLLQLQVAVRLVLLERVANLCGSAGLIHQLASFLHLN